MTAKQETTFAGIDRLGQQVRLEWVISFPWNHGQGTFEGETAYSVRVVSTSPLA